MEEKLKISELLDYYVERYDLPLAGRSSRDESAGDGLKAYTAAVTLIIKAVKIGGISLWDAIKPAQGVRDVRRISIGEFERYCFNAWAAYIEKNCETYNVGALQADKERMRIYEDEAYWEAKAAEADAARDRAMEDGALEGGLWAEGNETVITDRTRQVGHNMMLEAIYNTLFESFQWEKLQQDLDLDDDSADQMYGEKTPVEVVKARYRLQSYLNYIGRKRK